MGGCHSTWVLPAWWLCHPACARPADHLHRWSLVRSAPLFPIFHPGQAFHILHGSSGELCSVYGLPPTARDGGRQFDTMCPPVESATFTQLADRVEHPSTRVWPAASVCSIYSPAIQTLATGSVRGFMRFRQAGELGQTCIHVLHGRCCVQLDLYRQAWLTQSTVTAACSTYTQTIPCLLTLGSFHAC